eukprot:6455216-Amphidinium_carterae.1
MHNMTASSKRWFPNNFNEGVMALQPTLQLQDELPNATSAAPKQPDGGGAGGGGNDDEEKTVKWQDMRRSGGRCECHIYLIC